MRGTETSRDIVIIDRGGMIHESTVAIRQRRMNMEKVTALLKGVMASVQKMLAGRSQGQKKK